MQQGVASIATAPDTGNALAALMLEIEQEAGRLDAVSIFHAVRRMPYASTGDRSLAGILHLRAGSCSSKHVLLAALLNHIGITARVLLVRGDFAAPLSEARDVPAAVLAAAEGGIPDVHNIVEAMLAGVPTLLDATWHDAMIAHGFRVNQGWSGQGNTQIALDVEEWLGTADDIAAEKARRIASWPQDVQARRRAFLEAINHWVAGLGVAGLASETEAPLKPSS
jgi:Transglutaminase-like superfamily